MTTTDIYEVFAIRYATVQRRASENFIGGDLHETAASMDYFVWLVRSQERLFLVDTGFNRTAAERRGRQFLRSPVDGLKVLGVDATHINDIILTHLHYDHVGNYDLFPHACFYLQKSELAYATGPSMRHGVLRGPYDVDDVIGVVRALYSERIVCIDGSKELAPGITVHHVGGHTAGLQVVRVNTSKGWLVLASDATHYYANYQQGRPFPIVHNVADMLDGYDCIRELASSPELVIPGHDPLVMSKFSAPSNETEGIVVRLG